MRPIGRIYASMDMTKGEQTRQHIIRQAATVFNQRGFTGSSISDVMASTGLQKGGIYRHFASKEELALASFDYAQAQSTSRLQAAVSAETGAIRQLLAVVAAFRAITSNPPVPGGCPILNTIVDSDDGDPALRARVREVVVGWEALIAGIVEAGLADGTVRAGTNPQVVAAVMVASLEGGILLSRAHRSTAYFQHVAQHLAQYIERDIAA